jgi:DNA-binding SARP family transcriptional activator
VEEDRDRVGGSAPPGCYQVRLFGPFRVIAPDGSPATPASRKARALLAHLIVVDVEAVSRERLAGLLWGERNEEQARASLRQSLYEMRSLTASPHPLVTIDRARIGVTAGRVFSDLDRLRGLGAGHDAAALAAAIGERPPDLLEDLEGLDPGFDEWLAAERIQRHGERRRIALEVGGRALAAGDGAGAHRLAACLLCADPTDEAAARLAMAASHLQGDHDGLRQTYARLVEALRRDVEAAPSDATDALRRTLADSSAVAPTTVTTTATATATVTAPSAAATAVRRLASFAVARRRWLGGATLLLVAALAVARLLPDPQAGRRLLLVQPLVAPADDPLALELGKGLASDLARMIVGNDQRLSVVEPDDVSGSAWRRAQFVVTGSARSAGGLLQVDLKLLERDDSVILWSRSFARPAGELVALREQIASKLADVTICGLGGRNPSLAELGTETLRLYLGACEHKHDDWSESAKLLTQVVQRQPGFAHGWAMLAAGTTAAAYMRPNETAALHRQADGYAARALALDPHDGEAYYARAETLPGLDRWAQRMTVLQAGHAVDPTNAPTNAAMSHSLAGVGRWKEAIAFAQQGEDADPFSPGQATQLMQLLGFGPDPGDAGAIMERARRRFPNVAYVTDAELAVAGLVGDPRRAARLLADPDRPTQLPADRVEVWHALIDARADRTPAHLAAAVRAVLESAGRSPSADLSVVEKLVVLGRVDDAFRIAATVDAGRVQSGDDDSARLFRSDMAPFRADARFIPFAARFGLVAIWQRSDRWPDFCGEPALPYDCRTQAGRVTAEPPLPDGAGVQAARR